jgi:hypothetical protein
VGASPFSNGLRGVCGRFQVAGALFPFLRCGARCGASCGLLRGLLALHGQVFAAQIVKRCGLFFHSYDKIAQGIEQIAEMFRAVPDFVNVGPAGVFRERFCERRCYCFQLARRRGQIRNAINDLEYFMFCGGSLENANAAVHGVVIHGFTFLSCVEGANMI